MNSSDTVSSFAALAVEKDNTSRKEPVSFLVLTLLAGAYIGFGILLIFSVGQGVPAGMRPLVMGACFGVALTLVIFAGAELFTGHTMYMTLGLLTGTTSTATLGRTWLMSWIGNLLGSTLLATLFVLGGGGFILGDEANSLLLNVAQKKATAPGVELFFRAILCNWLVCLAIWMTVRTTNDMAKCVVIFWCLLAFIATGFEHSVANMTIFAVSLFSGSETAVTTMEVIHNLIFVTAGNVVAGSLIMGVGYWVAAGCPRHEQASQRAIVTSKVQRDVQSR